MLTVAVSISSGVAQITSAFSLLLPYRVEALGLTLLVMLINLRGVRESGTIFAIPSYFFVAMMAITVLVGMIRYVTGTFRSGGRSTRTREPWHLRKGSRSSWSSVRSRRTPPP